MSDLNNGKKLPQEVIELLNEITELIYIADAETYELLFINTVAQDILHIEELTDQKCYEVLQNRTLPCPFCSTPWLTYDGFYAWEFENPVLKRHYLLKDKMIHWGEKKARLEIAFDITQKENEKIELTNALDAEHVVMECVKQLYAADEPEDALPGVLEKIGTFLTAERAYLFRIQSSHMNNIFEWCALGTSAQIGDLQGLDFTSLDRWIESFENHQCIVIENLEDLQESNPVEYALLHAHGIHSLVAAPLENDGKLIGYLGVDNPPVEKIHNIIPLFNTLRYFIMVTMHRAQDEKLLKRLSYYDTLTGFYNRNRYIQDINEMVVSNDMVGVAYIDINGLKEINDQYGHAFGDQILVKCGQNIQNCFDAAKGYRVGGDEFIILCKNIAEEEFNHCVIELKKEFTLSETYSAAIGTKWGSGTEGLPYLIECASKEMNWDKKRFYHKTLSMDRYRHQSDDVLQITAPDVLQKLLKEKCFVVYFQPKISFSDRTIVGAEALVRLKMNGEIIPPLNFIPLLEESRLIAQVDFYVFEFVCEKLALWLKNGKNVVPIAVNFSRYSLLEKKFIGRLEAICEKYQVDKKWLEIEITESVEGVEGFDIGHFINKTRKAGFALSIDDFGTHYANLSLFVHTTFDVLKIDKSLIDNVVVDENLRLLLKLIGDYCTRLGIQTVAEGVETEAQFEILKEVGFNQAQGYLLSHPLVLEEYEDIYL